MRILPMQPGCFSLRLVWISSLALCGVLAAEDLWLVRVQPLLTKEERARYAGLNAAEREAFQAAFFDNKAVTGEEYFARITHIDQVLGSGKEGSGVNTDPGKLYLALGPPTSVHRVPSSRIFVPTEVWFYDHVPGLPYSSRLQFLFFRPRETGSWRLYQPQLHTIRALMLPLAGTRELFPVNDMVTANDVLNRLNASPAEQEIIEASMGVARGITGSGNGEILGMAMSPAAMLRRAPAERVRSRLRLEVERPKFSWRQVKTEEGEAAVEIALTGSARKRLSVEVPGVDVFETHLQLPEVRPFDYSQRLFLLPGRYWVVVSVDDWPTHFLVEVKADAPVEAAGPVTYRANLHPGAAPAAFGRQHLRAGRRGEARVCFERSLAAGWNAAAATGLAQLDALQGRLDEGRTRLQEVLRREPGNFEALVALAAIAAEFQDWPEAARYYREALAIRPHPGVQAALLKISGAK